MNTVQKIESWGEKHHPKWLDILRIILGAIIFYKGFMFISDSGALQEVIRKSYGEVSFWLIHYIVFAHLVGGAMILWGLGTRIATLFQIPILVGAIIFVNSSNGIFSINNDELWFSILILFLLVFFLVEGSGPWSLDAVIRKQDEENEAYYNSYKPSEKLYS